MSSNLVEHIKTTFQNKFGTQPILVRSPGRINLIGEHTDYNDGFVFPAAIDKYIVSAVSTSEVEFCTVYAIDKDEEFEFTIDDIKPLSSNSWKNYVLGVVSEIQKAGKSIKAFNLVFGSDIPEGAGLSSSAALENSIVFALNSLFDLKLSKLQMILISQKAEHNYVGVKCGIMDQFANMFGIKDHAFFLDCRSLESTPFKIDFKNYTLVLINSNVKHNLADNAYNERRLVCEKAANLLHIKALRDASVHDIIQLKPKLTEDEYQKVLYIVQENLRVQKAVLLIKENDLKSFGKLLFEAHKGMKNQFKISCDELDFLVDQAYDSPVVIGARMMGGGFGGCTINIIEETAVENFISNTKTAYSKKFNKECSVYFVDLADGTQLI